ncbi:trypsin-like serine protease [Luteibacter sp. 3190]|uniref:trypsin-like serine protease n=1 Tax=Luteibacter sp. 3190 TaxID=2817736 RepID=UPI0028624157|nr:trypsin-like serine protease [Luteibacter sp. 3190]MDR6938210.1 hypothetical protein [Luteibacter sp. 3190]
MKWSLVFCLWAMSSAAGAVITRADVDDARYRVDPGVVPALADLPGEGHGVLIAPRWVLTAAHAAPMMMDGMETDVSIGGVARRVSRVVVHPGYRKVPEALIKEVLASGDFARLYASLGSSDDIALIELASPVSGVTPMPLYRGDEEAGKTAELFGKGATGHGDHGQDPASAHRTVLRHAFNVIEGADARYVWYRFDAPPAGLPLEGITGGGDSGGPLVVGTAASAQLVGLGSWSRYPKDHPFWKGLTPDRPFVGGLYGVVVYAVRVSRYAPWIDSVMASPEEAHEETPK